MQTADFIQSLPESLRSPLREGDFSDLLHHVKILWETEPTGASLAVWQIANEYRSLEALQVLSFCLVRAFTGPIAEASRVWLLQHETDDLSTLVNILSGLDVAVVEGNGLPDYVMSVLPDFLIRCLEHDAPAVRISVLDFLRDHQAALGWPRRFGRTSARQLADALERQLADVVLEEEVNELAFIATGLRLDVIPLRPAIKIEPVNELIADLEQQTANAADLTRYMRVRRLRDDAKKQAQHYDHPILTVRIWDGVVDGLLSCIKHLFDLCRFENVDPTDKVWLPAPAASQAKHLRARVTTTKETFERFRLAGAMAEQPDNAKAELAQLPPRQAQAVASMLVEAARSGVEAEFIFTSPDVSDPQQVVNFRRAAESAASWGPSVTEAERVANERPEVYSDEVPQANTVRQVIQAVLAILVHGEVHAADIDNIKSGRQVNYYTSAARSLGLLDDDNNPTELGCQFLNKAPEEQLAIAAVAFEQSMVGRAWKAWAKKKHLADVDPATAESFLDSRAIGISGSTIPRRASTLRKWQVELLRFYRS